MTFKHGLTGGERLDRLEIMVELIASATLKGTLFAPVLSPPDVHILEMLHKQLAKESIQEIVK